MNDARVLVDTLRLAPPPDAGALRAAWTRADAGKLIALATSEGAALWLQRRLASLHVALEERHASALAAAAKRIVAHMMRVDAETANVIRVLKGGGIDGILLKAAAMRRLAARVPFADVRYANDVDVLVDADAAQAAWTLLGSRGFRALPPTGTVHHLPMLIGPSGVAVEVHTSTDAAIPPAEAWRRATTDGCVADFGGAPSSLPSDTELLWHAVNHAARHVNRANALRSDVRLSRWIDAAALLAAAGPFDWSRIRERLASAECARPELTRAWLRVAADFAGRPLPADALGGSRAAIDIERLLRWRLSVVANHEANSRWREKLLEEGTRGEVMLAVSHSDHESPYVRLRHALASRAARAWWLLTR